MDIPSIGVKGLTWVIYGENFTSGDGGRETMCVCVPLSDVKKSGS